MLVKFINSGSKGNGAILKTDNSVLCVDCGVSLLEYKKALDFNVSIISGAIVTHEHG